MVTVRELADLVGGRVEGDGSLSVTRLAPIEQAGEGEISFIANPKFLPLLQTTRATAVVVTPDVTSARTTLVVCDNPYLAFAKILERLHVRRPAPQGVMAGAHVHPEAELAEEVTVHPGCVVGKGVRVGRGTILYPNVVLYEGVTVGADCTLHAGAVVREGCRLADRVILQPGALIGGDGFGFAPDGERYYHIPQVGIVDLEEDVEIGAGTCVDRAALGVTRVRRGTKIDNLVQVAHNVEIGEDTIVVAQVGIAGSTRIGRHCTLGGRAGIAGHIKLGDNTILGAQSGVTGSLEGGQIYSGFPAVPHREWLRAATSFVKIPEMRKEISRLQKRVEELEQTRKGEHA